jgi:hypothetical protein
LIVAQSKDPAARQRKQETETHFYISAKPSIRRSGVSAERRKPYEIEKCGFLPKAATILLRRNLLFFRFHITASIKHHSLAAGIYNFRLNL